MTCCIKKATSNPQFNYHWLAKEASISHLIFADDVFLFCKGDIDSVSTLFQGVQSFSSASGLSPNRQKSHCFFGNVPLDTKLSILDLTGFLEGQLPIKYLGLPLVSTKLNFRDCTPLIIKICSKIDSWLCRFLSFAGRLQLLKIVLYGIQGFWSLHLFLQKGVLKRLTTLFLKFLWGGCTTSTKPAKVAWSDCCLPKEEGGLGLRDLFSWNRAAIFYHLWRLLKPNSSSAWVTRVRSTVLRNKAIWTVRVPYYAAWCLKKILNARQDALRFINYSLG